MVHDAFLRADHVFSREEIEVNFIKVNTSTLKKENSRNVNRILSTKMSQIFSIQVGETCGGSYHFYHIRVGGDFLLCKIGRCLMLHFS